MAAGAVIHRVHRRSQNRSAVDFNPCRGEPTRFAPLRVRDPRSPGAQVCIPTLYLGETFEAALFETAFRDLPPLPKPRVVFESQKIVGVSHAEVAAKRELRLAPLFEPDLNAMGLTRRRLIASHGRKAYAWTVQWAAAIHRSFPDLDGLAWTSRQNDSAKAYMLFGDRADGVLRIVADQPVDSGPGYARLKLAADRYRIRLVPPP